MYVMLKNDAVSEIFDNQLSTSDDGEMSTSTSDSQGSVIHVDDHRRPQRFIRSPSPGSIMSTGTWPSSGSLLNHVHVEVCELATSVHVK